MNETPIQSLEGFIGRIRMDRASWPHAWFRAEPSVDTPIVPKLYRPRADGRTHNENQLLQFFRMRAPVFSAGACDAPKGVVARLAGVEIPVYADNEKTLAELKARIARTIAFIQTVKPAQIDGSEDREIVIKRGDKETRYSGMQFLLGHAVPNFYFHVTTAYNILRHNGIDIGKRDYIGNP